MKLEPASRFKNAIIDYRNIELASSPVVMSASYGRTYLANLTACKGSFKSDKQLINAGLIILSLGFFADFVEVLCIAKIQQRFSMLLGRDIITHLYTPLRIAQNVSISTA